MLYRTFFFLFFLTALLPASRSQSTTVCPPNIGFELGSFANWQTNVGSVTASGNVNLITFSSAAWLEGNTPGRQDLMDRNLTTPATDLYGSFPVNPPGTGGGRYALKLGNDGDLGTCNNGLCPDARAEAARYIVNVPANATDYSITFSYAVVLENPQDAANIHRDEEQPRFNVRMYDPVTQEAINCANFSFVASGPLPGFSTSPTRRHNDAVVRYKPWSSVYVNLSRYSGRTLYLEFTTADCTKGGHFGYAYVDVTECGVAARAQYRCTTPNVTQLFGPPGFESYRWYSQNFSTLVGTTQDLTISPGPAIGTQYWVVATPYPNTGCPSCDCRDTVSVIVTPSYPTADAGPDQTVCPGTPVTIGTSAQPGNTYSWSPARNLSDPQSAVPQATVSAPASYQLTVTNDLGCSDTDTVALSLLQPFILRVQDDSACANQPTQLLAGGASSYTWSPAAGLSSTAVANPVATVSATTTYTVIGTDSADCFSDTASVTVTVLPTPTVSLGADVVLPAGSFLTLNSTVTNGPIVNWLWTPAANLTCNTCPEPTAEVKSDIAYRLRVTNGFGCTGSDTLNIKALCENGQVYIPNAFTPDGDGVNDVFMVQGRGIYTVKSLRIFNRWGELIFERLNFAPNNPANGWDGKIRGVVGPPDVFVYTAEVLCNAKEVFFFKGNVSVLK